VHGGDENCIKVLVGKPEGKRPLGGTGRRWEDNIKMDLMEIGLEGVHWIHLTQVKDHWRVPVNGIMNLRFP
jgi:hypothetical protein